MKLILLAATALIATPVIAQDTTGAGAPAGAQTTPPTTADPAQTPPASGQATDPAAAATAPQTADPSTGGTAAPTAPAPADPNAATPAGGYQPTQRALQGTPAPGGAVRFQQAPSPSQAYPAPAPKDSYPICKKGQYDGCRQRGGK